MMIAPNYRNRTPKEIISKQIYHNASGFMYRAMSWLDVADRSGHFAAFHYACIDARQAIEHLIFEQLAITAGDDLDAEKYKRCVDLDFGQNEVAEDTEFPILGIMPISKSRRFQCILCQKVS